MQEKVFQILLLLELTSILYLLPVRIDSLAIELLSFLFQTEVFVLGSCHLTIAEHGLYSLLIIFDVRMLIDLHRNSSPTSRKSTSTSPRAGILFIKILRSLVMIGQVC